jgi:hypothetical protein
MSFQGPDPYGTPGGTEVIIRAQSPEDVRIAQGRSFIVFLRVNGPITERFRENVEDVVRILGLSGLPLVAIIVRENGVVRDANASDVDYAAPLTATQIAPGVVVIDVAASGIDTAEIANAAITLAKLAANSVDSSKIVDDSIVNADINSAAAIVGSKLANTPNGITTTKINDAQITLAKMAAGVINLPRIGDFVFSGVSGIGVSPIFSGTYDNYLLVGHFNMNTANTLLYGRFSTGAGDDISNLYYWGGHTVNAAAGELARGLNPQTYFEVALPLGAGITLSRQGFMMLVIKPFYADYTEFVMIHAMRHNVPGLITGYSGAAFNGLTQFTGISFATAAGLIEGRITAYGITQ